MKKYTLQILYLLLSAVIFPTQAIDIYVSSIGSDVNKGNKKSPFASLAAAQQKARQYARSEPVTVHVANGVYYLPNTLVFTPEDSGTKNHPVLYKAQNEGGAILSGGASLDLIWMPFKNGIFKATTPSGLVIDQLFINEENQRMARYPNYDPKKKAEPYQGYASDAFSKTRASSWAKPKGGYIHAMHQLRWGGYHYYITGKDDNGDVLFDGGWQNNRQSRMHWAYRMVENIFEELDDEGEWYHSIENIPENSVQKNTLYYKPFAGIDLNKAKVEVVRLRHLIEFKGSVEKPVSNITLQGFVVRHAARTFMDTKEPLLRSDWTIYRGGAMMLTGTEHIKILDTEFDQVGGNAIFVNNYNRNTLIKGCYIHDTGASGVSFVGDPNAVRDPLFEYRETNDLTQIDLTPGPKTANYPSLGTVEDCLIHSIGTVERQPAGVQISMAMDITVRDTSIYDTARAGINVSEGTWGGHLIERCDVFDTVLETHDHGSFNSWGRDRFWHKDRDISQIEIDKNPNLPFLDAIKTTTIRDSRWRSDHGWDIDLDDGSSNYNIYNNLMLAGGLKFREGFRRHAWNNISINKGFHPHVWYKTSKDLVTSNIFMMPHRPARMNSPYIDKTKVDNNFYAANKAEVMEVSQVLGWDNNSVFGEPMFIDPDRGDFRVKKGSPVFKTGFKNFSMDQFGVKKASLKSIARTPKIPKVSDISIIKKKKGPKTMKWFGATLSELLGEQFSAYGVSKATGGLALSKISKDSRASREGFLNGDLIQEVADNEKLTIKKIKNIFANTTGTIKLKIIRNQQVIEIFVTM